MINYESFPIIRGVGWGDIILGVSKEQVDKFLTDFGEITSNYNHGYFVGYTKYAIQINYLLQGNGEKVKCIFFYNGDENYEHMIALPIRTNENVGWDSTPFEVKEAYGNPLEHYSGTKDDIFWERIVYDGIDFRFLNRKLVRIAILS